MRSLCCLRAESLQPGAPRQQATRGDRRARVGVISASSRVATNAKYFCATPRYLTRLLQAAGMLVR